MGCRKSQASLTPAERTAYVNAVKALKTSVPSQMGLGNRYDDYVQIHVNAMMAQTTTQPGWAHRAPAFLPWHREFLRRFELDLQAIDPTVTIPYWDWTVDNSPDPTVAGSPWTNDFMGGNGDPVTTGPFAAGSWTLNVFEPGDSGADLVRDFGGFPGVSTLPTAANVTAALTETPYYVAPWRAFSNWAAQTGPVQPSFCNRLEGWYALGSIHNRVHLWVGGSMLPGSSPNDPVFWLHHCNIDRLWAQWQHDHPTETYHPSGAAGEVGPSGHNLTDPMQPWGGAATVASVQNHHALGYWYETDAPEVTLLTPSLAFTNIPEGIGGTGVTTYRAVVFEILACDAVTLQITAGPTAPFGTPAGLSAVVPATHFAPPGHGRLWISYTSTTAGASVTGSVTVHVVETGATHVINLSANTVARPKSAVALVLDRSGSMAEDAGDGAQKVAKLREAVGVFTDVMLQGDGLGVVRFDHEVQRLMDVVDVGPMPAAAGSGRAQVATILASHNAADTLDPRGATSIGGGAAEGKLALDTAPATVPPYSVKALLVLTDGVENTAPMIADVAGSISANTFAIGFGTPANISVAALNALTQNHNGYLVVTGALTPDERFRLAKYFLQILAGVTNANVVLDPRGELIFGATHRIPFTLNEADMGADVILLSPAPYYIDFALETPDGELIDPARATGEPAVSFIRTSRVSYYRVSLPALAADASGSHAGQWHALLRLGRGARSVDNEFMRGLQSRALPYNLLVHAYSNLRYSASVIQKSFEPGAEVTVLASLTEYDVPVERRATVWAEITRPDGGLLTLPLSEGEPGQFTAQFVASAVGLYTVRTRASGVTFRGQVFQREQTLTAATARGGDATPPSDGGAGELIDWFQQRDERLCKLLECLFERLNDSELAKRLARSGVDLKALEECWRMYCRASHGRPHAQSGMQLAASLEAASAGLVERLLAEPDALRVVSERERERRATEGEVGFPELEEGEPVQWEAPGMGQMLEGPMFDLSPEDKAAAGVPPEQPPRREHGATRSQQADAPAPPVARAPRLAFDLSPEDKAEQERGGSDEEQQGGSRRRRPKPR